MTESELFIITLPSGDTAATFTSFHACAAVYRQGLERLGYGFMRGSFSTGWRHVRGN